MCQIEDIRNGTLSKGSRIRPWAQKATPEIDSESAKANVYWFYRTLRRGSTTFGISIVTMLGANIEKQTLSPGRIPIGIKWRSSCWFTTLVVGFGIATDLLVYSVIIPVMPFQLQRLGYTGVSSLAGWLNFSYSSGLVLSTVPIAIFSERYSIRRMPLIIGLFILLGSQIMLMEAPTYVVMCIARVLQGVGSSMVWIVGLALLCESTPESLVGRQLGAAMAGLPIGLLIGPPSGGALYSRFGFRGPFIFGIIVTVFDLLGRIILIERKDAIRWGVDPTDQPADDIEKHHETSTAVNGGPRSQGVVEKADGVIVAPIKHERQEKGPISLLAVIVRLSQSSRALTAMIITFVYGFVLSSQEPTMPLYLQGLHGLDSRKVGLIFLAAVVPTLFSATVSGWLTDRKGTEWITCGTLLFALPWWVIIIIRGPLALFAASFALERLFTSGVVSPLMAELASVSREIEEIGYAHVYGAFNVAYGFGSAVGPVVGGQIYDNLKDGWAALCLLATGLLASSLLLSLLNIGADPLITRLRRWLSATRARSTG